MQISMKSNLTCHHFAKTYPLAVFNLMFSQKKGRSQRSKKRQIGTNWKAFLSFSNNSDTLTRVLVSMSRLHLVDWREISFHNRSSLERTLFSSGVIHFKSSQLHSPRRPFRKSTGRDRNKEIKQEGGADSWRQPSWTWLKA